MIKFNSSKKCSHRLCVKKRFKIFWWIESFWHELPWWKVVKSWFYCWGFVYWLIITASVLIVCALATLGQLFPNSSVVVLFLLIESFAISLIAYGFVVSAVVSSSKAAGLIASLSSIILALPNYAANSVSLPVKYLLCLMSPTALAQALTKAVELEANAIGMT